MWEILITKKESLIGLYHIEKFYIKQRYRISIGSSILIVKSYILMNQRTHPMLKVAF